MPRMTTIRQRFPREKVEDIEAALRAELDECGVRPRAGTRIALAVGSRGIAGIARLVAATAAWVAEHGAHPFIVPAMGSHGGATAEGQRQVLAHYGITEAAVGAPILSSLEVVELPRDDVEAPVYFDRHAAEADGTIVINRVKPHTSFHGPYESGLMKMMAVGLGKHTQALALHRLGVVGLREIMPRVARQVLRHGNVLLGVAVVENAHKETLRIRAIPAAEIPRQEPELLALARANLPGLPMEALDILVVDEMGKDISGLGMDTNVIGRLKIPGQPEPERPAIRIIIARDLSAASRGNATGMGLADIVTRRLYKKIDFAATYANVLTTGFLERGKLPIVAESDGEALAIALRACGLEDAEEAHIARIANTLKLEEMRVSSAVLREIEEKPSIEVAGPAGDLFDEPSGVS